MINALKKKLLTAQEGIAILPDSFKNDSASSDVIGSAILSIYQSYWANIHNDIEACATEAQPIDKAISELLKKHRTGAASMTALNYQLQVLPELAVQVQAIKATFDELRDLYQRVEASLYDLENDHAELEQRKRKHERIDELAAYSLAKRAELAKLKGQIAVGHAKKVTEYEQKNTTLRREKEKVFEDEFLLELEQYKLSGHVERQAMVEHVPRTLDDVSIDSDGAELDKFLEDVEIGADKKERVSSCSSSDDNDDGGDKEEKEEKGEEQGEEKEQTEEDQEAQKQKEKKQELQEKTCESDH